MSVRNFAFALLLAVPAFAAEGVPAPAGLTAHEWGTFTSVAGADGNPVFWSALSAAADLPCFVIHRGPWNFKSGLSSLVRMETPVLYFYAPSKMTLSVHVGFPQGLITEWYPQASRVAPDPNIGYPGHGEIDWNSVEVSPGENPTLPEGRSASHYYAARNTDSAPIRIGDQSEKLIFYRGVGSFSVPLRARFVADGALQIRNDGSAPIPAAILFEKRGRKIGYRLLGSLEDSTTVEAPELNGDVTALRQDLARMLVESGLYPKEAAAMIETWRDSWFEEGTRVFYLVPRTTVDRVLPLTITPPPAGIARVFVGRVEILSPATRTAIETAVTAGDVAVLEKYGRFLSPFLSEISRGRRLAFAPAASAFVQRSGIDPTSCAK